MVMTKASDVISDRLKLPLSVTCILPTNIGVGEKMPDDWSESARREKWEL